jgi:site-specific DNA-methyltransferase (adenine-specific)
MTYTIFQGDCLDFMDQMQPDCVDVIVTSPPYNIGIKYDVHNDNATNYFEWMMDISLVMDRVLKPDGSLFLNIGSQSSDPYFTYEVASRCFGNFVLQNHIIWVKSIAIGETTHGHFKPINSQRYLNNTWESIFHFTKSGRTTIDRCGIGVPFMDKSNISRRNHTADKRCAGNVWFIPYRTVQSREQKLHHPAGYPVDLPLRCIKLHGNLTPETVVLDPFMGTGTTLVAAEQLGVTSIGLELSPGYVETARNRLLLT